MPTCAFANPEPDPDPYFDPAQFFCEGGDWARAAAELRDGDVYRKAVLGLDAAGAAALRAALAPRLLMVDAGDDWVFVDASLSPGYCPVCGQAARPGRDTCGATECLRSLGRDELAARRRGPA